MIIDINIADNIKNTLAENASSAFISDFFFKSKYIGINALLIAPSANNLLKRFGSLNARRKLSPEEEAPKINANRRSLT